MGKGAHETTLMRDAIKKAYPAAKWVRVVNLMTPNQVTAVYLKLKAKRKI